MLEIPLSQVKAMSIDFEAAVAAHIKALEEHRFTEGEPAPAVPHALVEAAVERKQYPVEDGRPDDFVPAYRIIDDSPTLEGRKVMLANEATAAASAAFSTITPPLKANHWHYQLTDVLGTEERRRTAEQNSFVMEHEAREKRKIAVHRHLSQLHSDIHDLNETTIDRWTPAPFPK